MRFTGNTQATTFRLWFAKMLSQARSLRISNIQIEVHLDGSLRRQCMRYIDENGLDGFFADRRPLLTMNKGPKVSAA